MIFESMLLVLYFISLYFAVFWFIVFLFEKKFEKKEWRELPSVSVIVPAYNEEEYIEDTLKSLINLDYPKDKLEIIVVNDGSKDNTEEIVNKFVKKYRFVRLINQKNRGRGAAKNTGLKHARGEFIATLDADSLVGKKSLREMIAYFNENVTSVTPLMKVNRPDNLLRRVQRYEYMIAAFIKRLMGNIDSIYVTPGPFSIYRKEIVKKLGGFDEKNLVEDMDIAYRLQSHHYKIRQCLEGGESYSNAPRNLVELFKQRNRWYKGSLLNLWKYKKMLLNKDYGDFGMFQMCKNFFEILMSIFFVFSFVYIVLIPIFKKIYNFFLTKLGFGEYFSTIEIYFDIKSLNFPLMYLIIIFFLTGLVIIYLALWFGRERFKKEDIFAVLFLLFVYPVILGIFYIIALIEVLAGNKNEKRF